MQERLHLTRRQRVDDVMSVLEVTVTEKVIESPTKK